MIKYPKGYSKQTINSFEFEVYPDSAPEDWLTRLEDLKIQAYVSPFHDKDVKPDGTPKKGHFHIIVVFSGGKNEAFCQGIIDEVGGANGYGEVCRSLEGSIRYLVHLGCSNKYHYNPDEIICFGGAPLKKYFSDSEVEDVSTVTEVIKYIKGHKNIIFCDFVDYCLESKHSWLRAMRSTWFSTLVREYLKSNIERNSYFYQSHVVE